VERGDIDHVWVVKAPVDFSENALMGNRIELVPLNAGKYANLLSKSSWHMIQPCISDTTWQVVGVGDFNGDKGADIVWQNSATGRVRYLAHERDSARRVDLCHTVYHGCLMANRRSGRLQRGRQCRYPLAQFLNGQNRNLADADFRLHLGCQFLHLVSAAIHKKRRQIRLHGPWGQIRGKAAVLIAFPAHPASTSPGASSR
jgi:hypothetical protein